MVYSRYTLLILEVIDTKLSQKELLCPPGWENNNGRQTFFFSDCVCRLKSWLTKPSKNFVLFSVEHEKTQAVENGWTQ